MKIPFYGLKSEYQSLRVEIRSAIDRVCENASFVLGPEVEAFEREFSDFCETKHCIALNSGTSALHIGLLALGVRPGHEVITTPNTFMATAEAIDYCGARPVFVDIDPQTANLDPDRIEAAITSKTKAIIPVHLYGRPADMDTIQGIARRHGLGVLEDACQAHGARYRGRRVGSISKAAAFSFYPTKNLGAYGEGGALTTNDDRIAEYARAARSHGQSGRYQHEFVGYNYRMDGIQAAILRVKLKRLPEWTSQRQALAAEYKRALEGAQIQLLRDDPADECAYHLFTVYVRKRDAVRKQMEEAGIETVVHYPTPLHLQPAYAVLGYPRGTFPHAEQACETAVSLPLFPAMTIEQARYVAEKLHEVTASLHAATAQ